jgi:DNA-binding IclR family transcriptional regulator
VARPALSASRTTAVINLLMRYPERAFLMAEIVRETKINVASCQAILKALTDSGYLYRFPKQKRYVLGTAIIAAGQAALKSRPIVERAQLATKELADELNVAATLIARIGDEVLALAAITDRAGNSVGMVAGERRKMHYYGSLVQVAWSSEQEISEFLAGAGVSRPAQVAEWREAIARIRERGYQVLLREPETYPASVIMAELAATDSRTPAKSEARGYAPTSSMQLLHPLTIEPDALYDVSTIGAPIFEQGESTAFVLLLSRFMRKLTGSEIERYGERLLRTCVNVMRENRTYDASPLFSSAGVHDDDVAPAKAKQPARARGRPRKSSQSA